MLCRNRSFMLAALVVLRAGLVSGPVEAQPGATYESLEALPDLEGAWTPMGPPFELAPPIPTPTALPTGRGAPAGSAAGACNLPPQFKPEAVSRCREFAAERAAAGRGSDFCARQSFFGFPPQGAGGAFEILFNPGRVTMAVESGLVRRIYLQDAPPAGSLDVSRSGTSIGRWEGSTLVVETTGLDPDASVLGNPIGRDARVVERFSLIDADTLQIEASISAPAVLNAPLTPRMRYRRAPDRVFTDFDTCIEGDRSFDRATGQDRFDRTPPPDLPPPPGD